MNNSGFVKAICVKDVKIIFYGVQLQLCNDMVTAFL